MAYLYFGTLTRVSTLTRIVVLYRNREKRAQVLAMRKFLHSTMHPLGLESEPESVPLSESGSVIKPLYIHASDVNYPLHKPCSHAAFATTLKFNIMSIVT